MNWNVCEWLRVSIVSVWRHIIHLLIQWWEETHRQPLYERTLPSQSLASDIILFFFVHRGMERGREYRGKTYQMWKAHTTSMWLWMQMGVRQPFYLCETVSTLNKYIPPSIVLRTMLYLSLSCATWPFSHPFSLVSYIFILLICLNVYECRIYIYICSSFSNQICVFASTFFHARPTKNSWRGLMAAATQ